MAEIVERWWVEGQSDFKPADSGHPAVDDKYIVINKTVVRRYYEDIIDNPDVAEELFATDHVHYPGLQPGPEGVKALIRMVTDRLEVTRLWSWSISLQKAIWLQPTLP